MNALVPVDPLALARDVLDHLDRQLASARRLLEHVLGQGAAIRRRDVDAVVGAVSAIRDEMAARGGLEAERAALLRRAAGALGGGPGDVTLTRLGALMPEAVSTEAQRRSAELRGLLAEIAREHGVNRVLMRQELSFLDHLLRLSGAEAPGGYGPQAERSRPAAPTNLHVLDTRA